jgi:hypothetical protein
MATIREGMVATAGTNADPGKVTQKPDWDSKIYALDPPGSPGLKILSDRSAKKNTISYEFNWVSDVPVPYVFSSAAGASDADTTLTIDANAEAVQVGDLLKVPSTGEVVKVTAVNTGTGALTIERGALGTTAAAIPAGSSVMNVRAAIPEGSKAPESLMTVREKVTNYTQIFRTSAYMSRTLDEMSHYDTGGPGGEWAYQIRKSGEAHARAIEEAFLHGVPSEDISGAKPVRTTGGLDHFLTQNALTPAGGTLTESDFIGWLEGAFRYSVNPGKTNKVLLASGEIMATISSWGLEKLRHNDRTSDKHGFVVMDYVSPFGTVNLVRHVLLEGPYAGKGYLLDMDAIYMRSLHSTELRNNIQDPDEDSKRAEYLTELGFEIAMPEAHGVITGVVY